jgi:4-hydroxy-tetrahydrodipicolinate synthase
MTFGRLLTAMITPFNHEGEVDYGSAERLADHLINTGTEAIVLCGTTGESPTLTWEEEYELFRVVRQAVGGRAKIIAGTGSNSTREAIVATEKAYKLGLDGTLQVTPYYNKPPQAGLYEHFRAIALSAPELPMILYNIPGRTACKLELETILRLAEIPNIVGIKEATGDLDLASQIRAKADPDFLIYSGDDSLTLPIMAVGGHGVISVASHLVGAKIQAMMQSFIAGKVEEARAIHLELFPLFKALFSMTNPIPIKAALQMLGLDTGVVRQPLVKATPEVINQLYVALHALHMTPD